MKKILITGGTVFVSRYAAEYYIAKGYDVYVLNRNSRPQPKSAKLLQADRHHLGNILRRHHFDVVIDTAYTAEDVNLLLDALESYRHYFLISSSAVYPEHCPQPFTEETPCGANLIWSKYGTDKIKAEQALFARNPNAYILRPPYLYGAMNNIYREAFVFDCALADRPFYLPKDGEMKLQFFHVYDLCRFIEILWESQPKQHLWNVGNQDVISVRKWVELCYLAAGKQATFINVYRDIEQRNYFCFYNYEYFLDVSKQLAIMPDIKPLHIGLSEALNWYKDNAAQVNKKPYFEYIDSNLKGLL